MTDATTSPPASASGESGRRQPSSDGSGRPQHAADDFPALPARRGASQEELRLGEQFRNRYAPYAERLIAHRTVGSPVATLVVISYKAKEYLLDCLRQLRSQTLPTEAPYEILLADSGGLEHLRDRYDGRVDIELRLTPGLPLNVARNAAAAWARGEFIGFIDDDGLVSPDWLRTALTVMRDPTIALARGRILPHQHVWFNLHAGHYDRGDAQWDDDSLATEGNMVARRETYLAIGGFSDHLYGAEGCRLVYQLKRAHPTLRAVYAPGMVMRHDYCRSVREFVWKCRRYRTTNQDVVADDPGFEEFLDAYRRRPKPSPSYTAGERIVRRVLRASEWVITRVSAFDRLSRR